MISAAQIKLKNDENDAADKFSKVKKFGSIASTTTTTEQVKRSALGDLQNRAVLRSNSIGIKDAAQKEINDVKLQNVKARVDTHWKKMPLAAKTNGSTAATTTTTTSNIGGISAANVANRKVLTRSNSLRTDAAAAAAGKSITALQKKLTEQQKTKTLTTKVVENKSQLLKAKKEANGTDATTTTATATTGLRREDSNLSRKTLAKLKILAVKQQPVIKGRTTVTNNAVAANVALATKTNNEVKKEKESATLKPTTEIEKKRIVSNGSNIATLAIGKPIAATSTKQILSGLKLSSGNSLCQMKLPSDVTDIDAGNARELVLVSTYANDIYEYLFQLEREQPIRYHFLDGQRDITVRMRGVLIDWIDEVHLQFHLEPETFQMTVGIIDRYLQVVKDVERAKLQLVGVTALFMVAKYEELYPPPIADYVYITDDSYTAQQIIRMEMKIFKTLNCNLSRPVPIQFLRRFSKAAMVEDIHHAMSKYFLELALVDYEMAHYHPSEIAAAALFLSLNLLNGDALQQKDFDDEFWTPTLQHYSHYTAAHLRPIATRLAFVVRQAPTSNLKTVHYKYSLPKFFKISTRAELSSPLLDSIIAAAPAVANGTK